MKAYFQLVLATAAKALTSKAASSRRRAFNPATAKYDFRVFLLGLGLIGDEFKTARLHLTKRLASSAAWKGVFALADLGFFPAMIEGGDSAVCGEVYEVDLPTLEPLDVLEGHPRFYRRRRVVLADGTTAETYVFSPEQAAGRPTISSGDWRARQGAKS